MNTPICYYKNKKVTNVILKYDEIYIFFQDIKKRSLNLTAVGDCCSESWFEPYGSEFTTLIGNTIVDVVKDSDIEMEPSGRQECDQNTIYKIKLGNGDEFLFLLRNSSNGYYNGWLEIDEVAISKYKILLKNQNGDSMHSLEVELPNLP